MRFLKNILFWLLLILFPVFLITSNIRILSNQVCIYEYSINRYDIAVATGIENAELKRIYQHWIDYYNFRQDTPQINVMKENGENIDLLSEKEIIHLQDVRGLLQLDYKVQIITFIVIFLSAACMIFVIKDYRSVIKAFLGGNILVIALVLALGLLSVVSFDRLFLLFHQVSFANQFWILDPGSDYLIMLYPGEFFLDLALFGFGMVLLESLILAGICFWLLRYHKRIIRSDVKGVK